MNEESGKSKNIDDIDVSSILTEGTKQKEAVYKVSPGKRGRFKRSFWVVFSILLMSITFVLGLYIGTRYEEKLIDWIVLLISCWFIIPVMAYLIILARNQIKPN